MDSDGEDIARVNQDRDKVHDDEDEDHDPWGSSAGYTPLAELNNDSTIMLSVGPDSEGAFYANLSAFGYVEEEDDEDGDGDGDDAKECKEDDLNFRELADRALAALDNEYRATVQETADRLAEKSQGEELLPSIRLPSEDFGPSYFHANFDGQQNSVQTSMPEKGLPNIDTDAVRRAVGAIRMRNPNLNQKFDKWDAQQSTKIAPRSHSLIAPRHLAPFRKATPNAIHATSVLSRAATTADALMKLGLLNGQDYLRIDLLGCDHVECSSEKRLRQLFGPLVCWISEYGDQCPRVLQLYLIGPNVPANAPRHVAFDASGRLDQVDLYCQNCVYEDRKLGDKSAQLLVCFNAGIWGYKEWRPTILHLARLRQKVFFVVTAYTLEEAEEDADVIQDEVSRDWHVSKEDLVSSACIWPPQANAFASKKDRETVTAAPARCYRENAAWQAWQL